MVAQVGRLPGLRWSGPCLGVLGGPLHRQRGRYHGAGSTPSFRSGPLACSGRFRGPITGPPRAPPPHSPGGLRWSLGPRAPLAIPLGRARPLGCRSRCDGWSMARSTGAFGLVVPAPRRPPWAAPRAPKSALPWTCWPVPSRALGPRSRSQPSLALLLSLSPSPSRVHRSLCATHSLSAAPQVELPPRVRRSFPSPAGRSLRSWRTTSSWSSPPRPRAAHAALRVRPLPRPRARHGGLLPAVLHDRLRGALARRVHARPGSPGSPRDLGRHSASAVRAPTARPLRLAPRRLTFSRGRSDHPRAPPSYCSGTGSCSPPSRSTASSRSALSSRRQSAGHLGFWGESLPCYPPETQGPLARSAVRSRVDSVKILCFRFLATLAEPLHSPLSSYVSVSSPACSF